MNFIKKHLIERINDQVRRKQDILKHDHFYWFDEPIKYKDKKIDRFNRFNPYYKNEVLPSTYYSFDGKTLREIYFKLKNNGFYIYKKLDDDKSYKMRIKNK